MGCPHCGHEITPEDLRQQEIEELLNKNPPPDMLRAQKEDKLAITLMCLLTFATGLLFVQLSFTYGALDKMPGAWLIAMVSYMLFMVISLFIANKRREKEFIRQFMEKN